MCVLFNAQKMCVFTLSVNVTQIGINPIDLQPFVNFVIDRVDQITYLIKQSVDNVDSKGAS